jgi:dihydropyrimidinase
MTVDTVIAGGTVVTPYSERQQSIAIDGESIVAIGKREAVPDGRQVIDATGKIVMPGIVDPHVHIDEVPENRAGTYAAESSAAALGGVTTIIDFAWQGGDRSFDQADATLLDGIRHKRDKIEDSIVDAGLHGVVHRENQETLDQLAEAHDLGVTSFKMFLSTYPVGVSTGFVKQVFDQLAGLGAVAAVHSEDPSVCEAPADDLQRAGKGEAEHYPDSRPDYAEAMAVEDVVRLAMETDAMYYGVHTTSRKAAQVIAQYRDDGTNIRAETCTHYTALDRSVFEEMGCLPVLAPPIRSPDDREAMFEYLRDGTLNTVSTDHAVYHREYKEVDKWWDSPFGVNSLQVSLPVFHDEAVNKRGHSYSFLSRLMSTNPARTFGLPNKGTLEAGTDADIIVFDPAASFEIRSSENASNADYSIYDGREVTGSVEKTFVRGEKVADGGNVVGSSADGKYIARDRPDWEP